MVREIGQTTVAWRKTDRLVEARPELAGSLKRRTKNEWRQRCKLERVHTLLSSRGTGRRSGLRGNLKSPREENATRWGSLRGLLYSLNRVELALRRGFFSLEKICKHSVVRGTISFYNEKLQFWHAGRSAIWNASNVLKWEMLKRKYFVFSCVSLTVRMF